MVMEEKIVVLKDKTCKVQLAKTSETGEFYVFRVLDDREQLVAYCQFSLFKIYERDLNDREMVFKQLLGMDSDFISSKVELKVTNEADYVIKGNILTDKQGDEYSFKEKHCHLEDVVILSDEFQGIGLGTTMLKMTENLARKNNCTQIEGYYCPHGQFKSATPDFYTRNGYYVEGAKTNKRVFKQLTNLAAVVD